MSQEGLTEKSFGELVQRASRQTADLVRQELQLAQAEMQDKRRRAGLGAGLLGGAGLTALFGAGALVAAAILGIATALEPWVAALIVGLVLLAAAGILAVSGKREAEQATPPLPEKAMESVEEDVRHIKERTGR